MISRDFHLDFRGGRELWCAQLRGPQREQLIKDTCERRLHASGGRVGAVMSVQADEIARRLNQYVPERENVERDSRTYTALMWAARQGHDAIVAELLRAGADITLTSRNGSTALSLARKYGHEKCVELLEKARDARKSRGSSAKVCSPERRDAPGSCLARAWTHALLTCSHARRPAAGTRPLYAIPRTKKGRRLRTRPRQTATLIHCALCTTAAATCLALMMWAACPLTMLRCTATTGASPLSWMWLRTSGRKTISASPRCGLLCAIDTPPVPPSCATPLPRWMISKMI